MATLLAYGLTTLAPDTVASGVAGSSISNGSLATFSITNFSYATDPELSCSPPTGSTTVALAVSKNGYFQFTITPDAGKKVSLASLVFKVARGGGSTPRGWALRSSLDSYAANIATADATTARTTWATATVDLSGAAFQNVTTAITFRMYFYVPATSSSLEVDDLTLNGVVASVGVTNTDVVSGTITLGGTVTEAKSNADAATGTLTLAGTMTDTARHTATPSAAVTFSGGLTERQGHAGTPAGAITLTGTLVEFSGHQITELTVTETSQAGNVVPTSSGGAVTPSSAGGRIATAGSRGGVEQTSRHADIRMT